MKDKILILLAIFILLLLVGCTQTEPTISFEEGSAEISALLVTNNIDQDLQNIDPSEVHKYLNKEDLAKAKTGLQTYSSKVNTSTEDGLALKSYVNLSINLIDLMVVILEMDPETFTLMASNDFSSFCTSGDIVNMDASMKAIATKSVALKDAMIAFEETYPTQAVIAEIDASELDSSFSSVGFELFTEMDKPFERLCGIMDKMTVKGEVLTNLQQATDFCERLDEYDAAEVAFIAELDKFIDYMEEATPILAKSNPTMSQQYEDTALQMESMKLIITSGGDAFIESNCQ